MCSANGLCATPLVSAQCHLPAEFWRGSRGQNWARDSSLEIMSYLVSKTSFSFLIGVHLPAQKPHFPRLLRAQHQCWKEGRKVFFCLFLALLKDQFCSKWAKIFCEWCPWHDEHENVDIPPLSAPIRSTTPVALRTWLFKKVKISKNSKRCQNLDLSCWSCLGSL